MVRLVSHRNGYRLKGQTMLLGGSNGLEKKPSTQEGAEKAWCAIRRMCYYATSFSPRAGEVRQQRRGWLCVGVRPILVIVTVANPDPRSCK
jgi:hypothetical protein